MRTQKCRVDRIKGQRAHALKIKVVASLPLEVVEKVTRNDNKELQDSSDEEGDPKNKAIELAVSSFSQCSALGENIAHFKQEARRLSEAMSAKYDPAKSPLVLNDVVAVKPPDASDSLTEFVCCYVFRHS